MMYRNKRFSSCPNFCAKLQRSKEVLSNPTLLAKIQRQYERCMPRVLGHSINLPDLFVSVVSRGGYRMVCDRSLWADVLCDLSLPTACSNSAIGLRRIYHQYLLKHELHEYPNLSENFLTEIFIDSAPNDPTGTEFTGLAVSLVERNLGIATSDVIVGPKLHSNHYSTANLSDAAYRPSLRSSTYQDPVDRSQLDLFERDRNFQLSVVNWNDPIRLRDASELPLIELSLSSGLENEIDFALNSLLALSVSPSPITGASTSIRLAHCRNLLSLLLATVGLYDDGCGTWATCDSDWQRQRQTNFIQFWHKMITEPKGRVFLRPDVFINANSDSSDSPPSSTLTELFAPVTPVPNSVISFPDASPEFCRVQLVCTLLVNLVTCPSPASSSGSGLIRRMEDDDEEADYDVTTSRTLSPHSVPVSTWRENARFLASKPTAMRFAFLCAYAQHSGLRQLGLQLLSSLRYPMEPKPRYPVSISKPLEWTPLADHGCRLGQLTCSFISHCLLESIDRASLISGLGLLGKLATMPDKANEFPLLYGLSSSIWIRLAQLICVPDLGVVCAALEALRCLTALGPFICAFAWESCTVGGFDAPLSLLEPLLAFLTLEGQAMGSQSLHRINLVQRTNQFMIPPQQYYHVQSTEPRFRPLRPAYSHSATNQYRTREVHPRMPPPVQILPLQRPVMPERRNPPDQTAQPTCSSTAESAKSSGLMTLLSTFAPSTCTNSPVVTSSVPAASPLASELTDRLQMPPPSLPPPSALRRLTKQFVSRNSLLSQNSSKSTMNQSALMQSDDPESPLTNNSDQSVVSSNGPSKAESDCLPDDGEDDSCSMSSSHRLSNGKSLIEPSSDKSSQLILPQVNGIRTGILQAAMDALQKQQLDGEETQVTDIKNGLVNGLAKSNFIQGTIACCPQADGDKPCHDSSAVNGDCISSNRSSDKLMESLDNDSDNDGLDPSTVINGTGSSDSSDDTDSSSHAPNPPRNFTRRLMKRRRRWGKRNCLFTPKRRRDRLLLNNAKRLISKSTPATHNVTSPLKAHPIQADPLPDSVLGPSWKPIWTAPVNVKSADIQPKASSPELSSDETSINCSSEKGLVEPHIQKYICEWDTCSSSFEYKNEVSVHVYHSHLDGVNNQSKLIRRHCRWRGCPSSNLARAPFALVTHVLDVHCSPVELESRKASNSITPPAISSLQNMCSTVAKDDVGDQTAWSVIRTVELRQMHLDLLAANHHLALVNPLIRHPSFNPPLHPQLAPPREGPVTKHLRVSAALVLRNLVLHLEEARFWFLSKLPLLSELVMGCSPCETGLRTNDACSIIAQCLSICNRRDTYRQATQTDIDLDTGL